MIALHPEYIYSYAPAQVVAVFPKGCKVKFYDDIEGKLQRQEMYKISERRYNKFAGTIQMAEVNLTKHDAVVLDKHTGEYKLSMEALRDLSLDVKMKLLFPLIPIFVLSHIFDFVYVYKINQNAMKLTA